MANTTEGYVEAQTGRLKAETDTAVARALLTIQEGIHREARWIVAVVLGSVATAATALGVLIAVLR